MTIFQSVDMRQLRWTVLATLLVLGATPAAAVQFQSSQTLQAGLGFVTGVTFGPEDPDPSNTGDGCVYAVDGNSGTIHRVCFDDGKNVTSNDAVLDISGSTNKTMGIVFEPNPPAGEEHLYVSYAPSNNAPFNGRIARAISTDGGQSWSFTDENFITGLGRSSFDHQTNGLDIGPDGCLYAVQGNNSNAGYDQDYAESRLSSGVLRACFKDGNGDVDPGFDGDCGDGAFQEACDVEVYASGLRNPFDLLWHSNGNLYATDNDPGNGFRDNCGTNANTFGCPCQDVTSETGDELNLIEEGKYYGSPNPYRANPSGLQCQGGSDPGDACTVDADCGGGGTCQDLSSLCTDSLCGETVQCYLGYNTDNAAASNDPNNLFRMPMPDTSSGQPLYSGQMDGIDEYSAPWQALLLGDFCSDWDQDLVVTPAGGGFRHFDLAPDGLSYEITGGVGLSGLDVTVGPDGTIYAATLGGGSVAYLVPVVQTDDQSADFFIACAAGEFCNGTVCEAVAGCANPPAGDPDCDGLFNTADPCPGDNQNRCVGTVAKCDSAGGECAQAGDDIRIDIGNNGPTTDCNGDTWLFDTGNGSPNGGQATPPEQTIVDGFGCDPVGDPAGTAATTQMIKDYKFGSNLDGDGNGELLREYPVQNGDYLVNLYFAEVFNSACVVGAPGHRSSDVYIEGQLVAGGPNPDDGLAAYAESLAQNGAANACGGLVIRSFVTTVSDGAITIFLDNDTTSGDLNSAVQALEVLAIGAQCSVDADCDDGNFCTADSCVSGQCQNPPTNEGLTCDDGDPGTINDVCTAGLCVGQTDDPDADGLPGVLDPCPSDPRNLCFGPVATDGTTGNPIRLNANSSAAACAGQKTDCNGDTWLADFGFNQGSNSTCNLAGGCPISGIDAIFGCTSNTETEDLFQCERWDPTAAPELLYDFDVPDGDYLVNLYFANSFTGTTAVGSRVFDIVVEGQVAYADFDQVAEAGGSGVALVRSALATVSGGDGLQIEFLHGVENPAIKAIEVLSTAPPCTVDGDCSDGNVCNGAETCDIGSGACLPGTPLDCSDGDICTQDTCDPVGGCANPAEPDGTPCLDGDACNGDETCQSGTCTAGAPPVCDDGSICTADFCVPETGCQNDPISCDDADACTADSCDAVAGCQNDPIVCDDGNECTADSCDSVTGCEATPVADGATCDDGLACTISDQCTSGVCGGTDDCPAGETCDPGSGICEAPPAVEIRINVNGPEHVGTDFPGTWAADAGVGGVCGPNDFVNNNPMNGTVDDPLFQGEVYGNPMTCAVGGGTLPPGDYIVNLLFAEVYFGGGACPGPEPGAGKRVFDVVLEGQTLLSDLDIFAEAGCTADTGTPLVKSFQVTITDGTLDISLPATVDNGKISAIEILSAGPQCVVDGDCDDGNVCTDDVCNAGVCEHPPVVDGTLCNDGLSCTINDACMAGACLGVEDCPAGEFCDPGTDQCVVSTGAEAFLSITPSGGIEASTFGGGSFSVTNDSTSGQQIQQVVLDFSTAIFPDLVFDPNGTAGDAGAKCLSADSGAATTGFVSPGDPCADPFSVPNEGGFYVLTLDFTGFDPGETFTFSVDVDPTSIQGGSGTGAAGAVSGLELTGSTATVQFSDGTLVSQTFRTVGSDGGSQNIVKSGLPPMPAVQILGVTTAPVGPGNRPAATVGTANQTVRVNGPPGTVRLVIVEGELDLFQAPGFDIEAFEANTAVNIQEFGGSIGGSGFMDFPVTLTQTAGNPDAGLNHVFAAFIDPDGSGRTGPLSEVVILELNPGAVDGDGDGYFPPDDCDDGNAAINPGAAEVCDGVDNNCDGQIDEGNPGGGAACNTGLPGACQPGTETCQGGTLVCVPDNAAADDTTCDGVDDDCDGVLDEDFVETATSCGVGLCEAMGQTECVAGQVQDTCQPGTPAPADATCDGLDEDCDGQVDEDFNAFDTNCGEGFCQSMGRAECVNGAIEDSCTPKSPGVEVCDGVDNNCDGVVDDGLTCSAVCNDGIDNDGDGAIDSEDAGCYGPNDTSERAPDLACDDGIDNDMDGLIDFPADPQCLLRIWMSEKAPCSDGIDNDGDGAVDAADSACLFPGWPFEKTECSDGIDNDGDGQTDVDDTSCTDGLGPSESPACSDGIDNDGDGLIDFPDDPQCTKAAQVQESNTFCGFGFEVAFLTPLFRAVIRRRRKRAGLSAC